MITHLIGSFISFILIAVALLVSQAWKIGQMIRKRINIREFLLY
ncbi:hypothetical protein [Spirosoma endophyticum]|uniref:Uncharacterized protein n=1 Tax=Spirosoma endophyticum TaxID=662367 RepID=A0A1I1HDY9_9BACT|nr:hypothetical protein [Spirosoma endophyticum]SFC21832.1 hypothetical protein SAMN05216167_101676 [Spirosoma endophyticum]